MYIQIKSLIAALTEKTTKLKEDGDLILGLTFLGIVIQIIDLII